VYERQWWTSTNKSVDYTGKRPDGFWLRYGVDKHHQFKNDDSPLAKIYKYKKSRLRNLQHLRKSYETLKTINDEHKSKHQMNKRYFSQYNVKLSIKEINQKSIKIVAKKLAKRRINKRMNDAATVIQKHVRRYLYNLTSTEELRWVNIYN